MFFLASLLTGLVSFVALGFAWARNRRGTSKRGVVEGFLADEQRALSFYRIFSAAYDILNPHLYTKEMREKIVCEIPGGEGLRVLDVGCGTGYTTAGVLTRKDASEVIAVDMNPVQLKRAAKNLHRERGRLAISRGDADRLPFPDGVFDAVISVGAIEYFPDPEKTLKEFSRVAKRGGTVIVGGPDLAWFGKYGINTVFFTPSTAEMQDFFLKAGLEAVGTGSTGVNTFFGTGEYVVYAVGKKPLQD